MFNKLIQGGYQDPDINRRAETLNILLVASFGLSILTFLLVVLLGVVGIFNPDETELSMAQVYGTPMMLALLVGILYLTNRKYPILASVMFLIVFTAIFSVSDLPEEVADGRGLLFMALPVIIASFVLPPWMSFIFAGLVSIVVMIISLMIDIVPTPYSAFAYLIVALVSYLGATQLENALGRLRLINEELDRRVDERTAELRAANERLRELDRLKSRFVSTVSHELRTPLSAIQGFAEMLMAGIYGQLAARQERALSRILANTAQLLHLVNDLLDQARIEAGQIEIKEEVFDPEELIANTVEDLQVLTEEKVELQMDVELPDTIWEDPNRIRQILRNLIGNALKFTEEGSVTVRTFTNPEGDSWYLNVIDTGPGIPEEAQEYIFSPFRQVDGSETRTHRGVGLGLSITRQLVLLMEGEIWVESEVGVGSTFSVKLPVKTAQ